MTSFGRESSFRRTVGAEEELLLFGAQARPAPIGEDLHRDGDVEVEHEFKLEQAEIATAPTVDMAELRADLARRRAELAAAAGERGARVAGLASSPLAAEPTPTPEPRYARMSEAFGLVARYQLTCGTHVHVAVESRAHGVAVIDRIRPWLSVLVALSANSPYWAGTDSGYASYRTVAWGRWPTAGPTELFGTEQAYDATTAALIATGAALDPGMIYFDARLSARYPTVEIRVADVGQRAGDTVLIAALCRALVVTALDDAGPPTDAGVVVLRSAAWRAARYGLAGELVDVPEGRLRPAAELVDRLVDRLEPALRDSGDAELVRAELDRLLTAGGGAALQRADLARRGSVADVVDAGVARFSE